MKIRFKYPHRLGLLATFSFVAVSYAVNQAVEPPQIQFKNITSQVGLTSEAGSKYGGPVVADFDNNGYYDIVASHHDDYPAEVFWSNGNRLSTRATRLVGGDVHGIATGDYDADGDNDLLVALGGSNGTSPKPPRLFRNDAGNFVDVTETSGIADLGARGRSVRWVDLDQDGDLDILQINAAQMISDQGPRNILFENIGNGKFEYHPSLAFEELDAERVLMTDFNQDNIPDLVTFTPLGMWQGNGNFGFENVTNTVLPKALLETHHVTAATEADIDNDGDFDIYLARGKVYYDIANNAVSFDSSKKRLDLRDEGNKGRDGISFIAKNDVILTDFSHWKRKTEIVLPLYLGSEKVKTQTPVTDTSVSQTDATGFPTEITDNGWYIGYIGDGIWRLAWYLDGDLAWDVRTSVINVESYLPDWPPQNLNVPDILLRNDNGRFVDISNRLPASSKLNNWGVINGDFNNDMLTDFFVYHFGELTVRIPDSLYVNQGNNLFDVTNNHDANVLGMQSHGDMGSAFDFNKDGWLDILSGDDDRGHWYLYQNQSQASSENKYGLVNVGYSKTGIDATAALITVRIGDTEMIRRVGSSGSVHSQSLLNIAHFGLADNQTIDQIKVIWRDGSEEILTILPADKEYFFGITPTKNQ